MAGGRLDCTSSLLSGALQFQEVVILVNRRVNFKHILTKSNCSVGRSKGNQLLGIDSNISVHKNSLGSLLIMKADRPTV